VGSGSMTVGKREVRKLLLIAADRPPPNVHEGSETEKEMNREGAEGGKIKR